MQVLNLKRALRNPVGTAGHAVGSAVRSTTFLAAFVGIYSAAISLHRKLFSWDHKLLYYVAGCAPLPCSWPPSCVGTCIMFQAPAIGAS